MPRAFRLAGLLRLRELQEDRAAGALAASHGVLRSAEARRDATLATLAGHAMPVAADASAWRTAVTARGTLTHLLADAAIDVRDAGERVAADTTRWSQARSRAVALDKLRDHHRTLARTADERAEQVALDEVAARRAVAEPAAASPRTVAGRAGVAAVPTPPLPRTPVRTLRGTRA